MSFKLKYSKVKKVSYLEISNMAIKKAQCYSPILEKLFLLSESTCDKIVLNSKYSIKRVNSGRTYNVYNCIIVNELEEETNMDIYFKYSPLFDPTKYAMGKLPDLSYNHSILPKYKEESKFAYIDDYNNTAYIDGFFTYLSSILLNEHNFINGINFYGSYLGMKENFKYNLRDELSVVRDSTEFMRNKNKVFSVDSSFNDIDKDRETLKKMTPIKINQDVNDSSDEFLAYETLESESEKLNEEGSGEVKELFQMDMKEFIFDKIWNSEEICDENDDSCSSNSSNTTKTNNEEDIDNIEGDNSSMEDEVEYESEEESNNEGEINMYISNYPVNIIGMEQLKNTLESVMNTEEMDKKKWESVLLQIIFTLIAYNEIFNFTHNDLHTNNLMYKETDKENVIYKYDNVYYKVPTYGKIWKIIDFGRSVYKMNNVTFFSNSFSPNGDASTQFNCEPYYNSNKPEVLPNPSFDLCRLGCALFDYFYESMSDTENDEIDEVEQLIKDWCKDDKGRNVLYKKNGKERYPDFKLYKMIARTVTKNTPKNQLNKEMFSKYIVSKKSIKKAKIVNIDEMKNKLIKNQVCS